MRKSEKILREYIDFKDINQSEPVELLPLTIEDCMEDYAIESGKKYIVYGIILGIIIGFLITIAFVKNK
jgi:hypothetical protein